MIELQPISIDTARELVDFRGGGASGKGIPQAMADAQLAGAVALHNILAREGFAYLADEVGMGKTYVALGAVALMRFFHPALRVAYIAPRENIQDKWVKELKNFTRTHWRWQDHRVRTLQDLPAYDYVRCGNLVDWARQAARRPNRDVLLRLTSFSFPLTGQSDRWSAKRDEIIDIAPMIERSEFDLRAKEHFKRAYARAINNLLPHYDLVVVDEAHNLKGGRHGGAARNELVELVLGLAEDQPGKHYGRRFDRVLFLSATPLESEFEQLHNQLDLFGVRGTRFDKLADPDASDDEKRTLAKGFLVRRLTGLSIAGSLHTKNMYRREWRAGGCTIHDEALAVPDPKQRLIVALVQKKVAEVLRDPRFGASFQMGMLASFESFQQTAAKKAARAEEDEEAAANFDQTDQTEERAEREGIDTPAVNVIADSYRRTFKSAMPHPKMDAVVDSLTSVFDSGEKALVFVRRVRSVPELREKLCDRYDAWLERLLETRLDSNLHRQLAGAWSRYREERQAKRGRAFEIERGMPLRQDEPEEPPITLASDPDDEGGHETFFSWFFRGEGPDKILSGAAFRKNRFQSEGSVYSTFFEDNHVARLIGGPERDMVERLAVVLGQPRADTDRALRDWAFGISRHRTGRQRLPRAILYEAYQAAALTLLARSDTAAAAEAQAILRERFAGATKAVAKRAPDGFPSPDELLATRTFFTELRKRSALRQALWPEPERARFVDAFRAREQRRELLAAVARLGHTFIELWALAVNQLEGMDLRRQDSSEDEVEILIDRFLDLLEREQAAAEAGEGGFHAFHELAEVGRNHDLILAVNFPEVVERPLDELPKHLASTLGRQTPVAGMYGGVSKTVVAQFRMPGYPLALITTDVLQEGEDLHTFCSKVIHYGISWTPSAMEQRTGRVDRIASKAHRSLDNLPEAPAPGALLQVHYPFLADTVEVLQVEKVFERMNRFLRTIHHTRGEEDGDSRLDARTEFVRTRKDIQQIKTPLTSAFDVEPRDVAGATIRLDAPSRPVKEILSHFMFVASQLAEEVRVDWDANDEDRPERYGTVFLDGGKLVGADDPRPRGTAGLRQQPFTLYLRAGAAGRTLLHVTSPVGDVARADHPAVSLLELQSDLRGAKLCRLPSKHAGTYTLTVEGDVLFQPSLTQVDEVLDLVQRVAVAADAAERRVFGDDADKAYEAFAADLREEATRAAD